MRVMLASVGSEGFGALSGSSVVGDLVKQLNSVDLSLSAKVNFGAILLDIRLTG